MSDLRISATPLASQTAGVVVQIWLVIPSCGWYGG